MKLDTRKKLTKKQINAYINFCQILTDFDFEQKEVYPELDKALHNFEIELAKKYKNVPNFD